MMTLDEVNAMSADDFAAAFGDIAEHSPWVARHAASCTAICDRVRR